MEPSHQEGVKGVTASSQLRAPPSLHRRPGSVIGGLGEGTLVERCHPDAGEFSGRAWQDLIFLGAVLSAGLTLLPQFPALSPNSS